MERSQGTEASTDGNSRSKRHLAHTVRETGEAPTASLVEGAT